MVMDCIATHTLCSWLAASQEEVAGSGPFKRQRACSASFHLLLWGQSGRQRPRHTQTGSFMFAGRLSCCLGGETVQMEGRRRIEPGISEDSLRHRLAGNMHPEPWLHILNDLVKDGVCIFWWLMIIKNNLLLKLLFKLKSKYLWCPILAKANLWWGVCHWLCLPLWTDWSYRSLLLPSSNLWGSYGTHKPSEAAAFKLSCQRGSWMWLD